LPAFSSTLPAGRAATAHGAERWVAPLLLFAGTLLFYCINLDDGLAVHDELHHVLAARGLLATGEPRIADGLYPRGYLYTWLVAQGFRLFGEGLFAARLPAAVPMALLVTALFVWLRATAGRGAAWTAAILFALSPMALGIAQFARFYGLQCLAFFLAAIALPPALLGPGSWRRRALLGAAALALLLLAVDLQDTTLLGVLGLGLWAVLAVGLPWLRDPAVAARHRQLAVLLALLLGLAVLGGLWLSGELGQLWYRYRWTPLFNQGSADQFWFYHGWLSLFYPSLWPLVGLLSLVALAAAPRPAGLALVLFASAFLLNSFAGPKSLRYLAYGFPFLFALWGIGLAALWPRLRYGLEDLGYELGPALGIAGAWGRRLGFALVGAGILFLLLANPAWLRTATLLADIPVPPEEPYVHWDEAADELAPWVQRAAVVITTSELETLYHLGRYDILLSRSRLSEMQPNRQHEFGTDPRTGRPVVSEAATIGRIMDCAPSGLLVTVAHHWNRNFQADAETRELVEARARPLPLPPRSRILAWTWEQPAGWTAPADCAALPPAARGAPRP
jgi:hypothetical protein